MIVRRIILPGGESHLRSTDIKDRYYVLLESVAENVDILRQDSSAVINAADANCGAICIRSSFENHI